MTKCEKIRKRVRQNEEDTRLGTRNKRKKHNQIKLRTGK